MWTVREVSDTAMHGHAEPGPPISVVGLPLSGGWAIGRVRDRRPDVVGATSAGTRECLRRAAPC